MRRAGRTTRKAFTLIEVLLVIGILVVLGTVSVVAYSRIKAGADRNAAKVLVDNTVHALGIYQASVGTYPDTEQGLQALLTAPEDEKLAEKWRNGGGPFLKDGKIPVDPWGNEVHYELVTATGTETEGPTVHVWSVGPNGQDGDDDDIRSWSEEQTGT